MTGTHGEELLGNEGKRNSKIFTFSLLRVRAFCSAIVIFLHRFSLTSFVHVEQWGRRPASCRNLLAVGRGSFGGSFGRRPSRTTATV